MKQLLKNKVLLIGAGVVLVILVVIIGGAVFLSKANNSQSNQDVNALPTQIPIPTLTPASIGLSLKVGTPGQTVVASLSNTAGISEADYELDYTAKNPNPTPGGADRVPRKIIGSFDLSIQPVSKEIKLGTCSDVCHYDQDVQDISLILKITKSDGTVYQSQTSLSSAQ